MNQRTLLIVVLALVLLWYLQAPAEPEVPKHAKDFETGTAYDDKSASSGEQKTGDAVGAAAASGCTYVGAGSVSAACSAVGKWGGGRVYQAVEEIISGTSGNLRTFDQLTDADFIRDSMCQCYRGVRDSCAIVKANVPSIRTCEPGDCDCNPEFLKGGPGGEIPIVKYKTRHGGPYESVIEYGKWILPCGADANHRAVSQKSEVYQRYLAAGGKPVPGCESMRVDPLPNLQTNVAPPPPPSSGPWRGSTASAVGTYRT